MCVCRLFYVLAVFVVLLLCCACCVFVVCLCLCVRICVVFVCVVVFAVPLLCCFVAGVLDVYYDWCMFVVFVRLCFEVC